MTKPKQHEDDIVVHIIVIISILITTFIDAIKCLTSLNSKSSTPTPGKHVLPSSDTQPTNSGSMKTQRLSPSTKRRSTTAVQKKADGGTKQDSQSSPTVSSPRSKRSKPSSNTSTSTKSQTSQASVSRRRTTTTKSTSPTDTLLSTPNQLHITADDNGNINADTASRIEHQSTEHLLVLPEPQEEVQEHTVLRTKVSRPKL
jgi:hypothetical protein